MLISDSNTISDFIIYGENNKNNSRLNLFAEKYNGKVVPLMPDDFWFDVADKCSEQELIYLIKGILNFFNSNDLHTGGSVSPIRFLYEYYRKAYPQTEQSICTWIINNRNSSYEPFGSIYNNNAKSWEEHIHLEKLRKT